MLRRISSINKYVIRSFLLGAAIFTVFHSENQLSMKNQSSISMQIQYVNRSEDRVSLTNRNRASITIPELRFQPRWKCPKKLVILQDMGRTGNMFFEHLGCRLMAKSWERDYFVQASVFDFFDQYFVGWMTPSLSLEKLDKYCEIKSSNFVTKHMRWNPDPASIPQPFVKCQGKNSRYPDKMPLKLWRQIFLQRDWLLNEFQWRPELKENLNKRLHQLTVNRTYSVSVGVHVRMGDYQRHLNFMYGKSRLAGANYFNKAMNYFRNKYTNPIFFIVSNNMKWCKKNIMGDDIIYPGFGMESDPGLDLATISNCDHLIMTYGTFGLMAAFLKGGGEVIAADNFTTKPYPQTEIMKALKLPNLIFMSIK